MDSVAASDLIQIFSNVDIYMLIFVRVIGFMIVVPVLAGNTIPITVRLGFALILSSIIYTSGNISEVFYDNSVIGYFLLITKEFFIGFIIGFTVYFFFNVTYLAGHLTDQQMGFSMANVFDPISQIQVPISGNLYYFAICVLFIIANGHHMVIKALFYSYKALPIGSAVIIGNQGLFNIILNMIKSFFIIGITIAIPIMGVVLVLDIILGILVKTVPQMNVFVVGMPAKVIIGLLGIWLIMPVFGNAYNYIYDAVSKNILDIIKVLMP